MKLKLLIIVLSLTIFTNCTKEPVALNEYNPQDITKVSSVAAEITKEDIIKVQKRRAEYFK